MKRFLVTLFTALIVGTSVSAAAAGGDLKLRVNAVAVQGHPDVSVVVTAPAALAGDVLPAEAFSVSEGDATIAPDVQHVRNDTLQVVLVIDTSGSMQGPALSEAQVAAGDFIRQLPPGVEFSVVGFGSRPTVLTPFSTDAGTHLSAIDRLQATGETALYDALVTASRQFTSQGQRRAVVVLSDGGDTVSKSSVTAARRKLNRSGAAVYGIRYKTAETNTAALDVLAVRGRVFSADSAAALNRVYSNVADELVSQYRVSWTTQGAGKTPVTLTVAQGSTSASAKIMLSLPAPPAVPVQEPQPVDAPAPAVPDAQPAAVAAGIFATRVAFIVGGGLVFVGLAILFMLLSAPRRRQIRIMGGQRVHGDQLHRSLSELAEHAVQAAERGLERRNLTAKLNAALERAGINLRPAEFLVLTGSVVLTSFAVGFMLSGLFLGAVLAFFVALLSRYYLQFRASRRRSKFADQLNDTLQLMAGSLRAGYGMLQAIDSVAQEAQEPSAQEFRRLVVEARLGRDLTTALQAMALRLNNEDFEWVVQAILIHREVGGDLAEVLDTVAGTIRERNMIRRQVKALSAEGKLSGIILALIPPIVGVLISMTNPGYLTPLFTTLPGIALSVVGVIMMVVGGLWMRKTVRLVF